MVVSYFQSFSGISLFLVEELQGLEEWLFQVDAEVLLRGKPNDAWALNGLGALKMERSQPQEALKCFDAAIAGHPKFANALYAKALVLQGLGELPFAATTLKTLFREADFQDARSVPVFESARQLIVEVENRLAKKTQPDVFKDVQNYRAEVETLSGFPVRISADGMPEGTTGVAQISLSTLWRWNIPHVKICGLRRFYRHDVEKSVNSRYVHKPGSAQEKSEFARR